jgi:hypothetical protein
VAAGETGAWAVKHTSFSRKILDRIERKSAARRTRVTVLFLSGYLLIAAAFGYNSYRKWKSVSAPSWAEFAVATPTTKSYGEHVQGTMPSGLPYTLIVSGERWDLIEVDHFDWKKDEKGNEILDAAGNPTPTRVQASTDCKRRIIAFIPADNPMVLRENLTHEIFHAGACLHGGDEWWNGTNDIAKHNGSIDDGAYHLGQFMAIFLHDNPVYATWAAQ